MSIVFEAAAGTCVACALYFYWEKSKITTSDRTQVGASEPEDTDPVYKDGYNFGPNTSLKKVSVIWTTPQSEKLYFTEISKIWRQPAKALPPVLETPVFIHPAINTFWEESIGDRVEYTIEKRKIIAAILKYLDEQGDCPSVVNLHKFEAERGFSPTDYEILQKVPLWDHSLRVAKLFLKSTTHAVMAPDTMIIGLGHDLGKIPSVYDKYYATGDHPILARFVVDSIPEMLGYHRRKDILTTIEEHHLPGTRNDAALLLREADTEARKLELGKAISFELANQAPLVPPTRFPLESTNSPCSVALTGPTPPKPPGSMRMQKNRVAAPPPEWFTEDAFRKELRCRINIITDGNWQAVSMPDGIVWVKFTTLNEAIIMASGDRSDVRGLGADRAAQSALALSVLTACEGCLVDGALIEGQSATKCMVTTAKGRSSPMFLTPIKAQWFMTTPSQLEAEKDADIRRMVDKVEVFRG